MPSFAATRRAFSVRRAAMARSAPRVRMMWDHVSPPVALAAARHLVVFLKRPGGQAQFSASLALQSAQDRFGALHDWIRSHLADDLSLSVLAHQAGMSERSFSRHYAEAAGQTPARAIERLRVEAAQNLLLESRLPVKRIALRCGLGSEETMRRSFLRLLEITPQDYRSRFRS
jgi:transcriptional regulator GlxA family with amidase domain